MQRRYKKLRIPGLFIIFIIYSLLVSAPIMAEERLPTAIGEHPESDIKALAFRGKAIVINLQAQRIYAKSNDRIIYNFHISSGRPGKSTPRGSYSVLGKKKMHISSIYPRPRGGAGMPWSLHYNGNYFIHGYHHVPLRPASNGCIRLAVPSAKKLFFWAPVGTPVIIR
jgi:lipoprotein-anchoring transpeptidase ErfK/SrfK